MCFYFSSKVYDRLQKLGVCLTRTCNSAILDNIKETFKIQIVEAITDNRYIRFLGDNIDFMIGVRDERIDKHAKLVHYFGSAVLVYNFKFPNLSEVKPQRDYKTISPREMLLDETESSALVDDYVHIVMKVAVQHFPSFKFLQKELDRYPRSSIPDILQKTQTIPLPALHKHEQRYGDVVDILRFYESTLKSAYTQAGRDLTDDTKVHIGGEY